MRPAEDTIGAEKTFPVGKILGKKIIILKKVYIILLPETGES